MPLRSPSPPSTDHSGRDGGSDRHPSQSPRTRNGPRRVPRAVSKFRCSGFGCFSFGVRLTRSRRFAETELCEEFRFSVFEVFFADVARSKLLVQQSELLEQF